jgi:hypothetical protein
VHSFAPPVSARLWYLSAVFVLLAAGCWIRGWGLFPVPLEFWADEAWWATLLQTGEYAHFGFRPAGYMWLCRELLELGSPELWLRLPSVLAGCAALVCLYKCAEWSTRSRAAVLFVLLLAIFHPKLVALAKEFKPYSVEVFVFAALTAWTLYCLRQGRGRSGLILATLLAIPFCYPVVFLYPGIALALAGERLAILRRLSPRQWVYGALVVLPLVVLFHFQLFERLGAGPNRLLWGDKYDVFPLDTGLLSGVTWYVGKSWSLVTLPGALDAMPHAVLPLFGVAYVAGIGILVAARRWRELGLLATPLVAVTAANLLGYWPYGAFRANLFLIPGILLVIAQSVDWLATRERFRWVAYGAIACVLAVAVASGSGPYRTKRSVHWAASPQLTDVLADIDRRRRESSEDWSDLILADWHSWRPILFYLPRKPELREVRLVPGPVADLATLELRLNAEVGDAVRESRATRIWLVVTRLDAHAAILESATVARHAHYCREFSPDDRNYHPVLVELRVAAPNDLLARAAQRYHPRPRAVARTESTGVCERTIAAK